MKILIELSMLLAITWILALGALVSDILYWRHLRRTAPGRHIGFAVWALVTESLPILLALVSLLLRDNSTTFMSIAMWTVWAWIITVPPRVVCYTFKRLHLPWLGWIAATGLVVLFMWGTIIGRTSIRVNRVEVVSQRLPAGFDGFRIVQLSDIHIGSLVNPERELQRIVDSVNCLHPDLVIFTGDLINIRYTELDARAMRILGSLRAPYGVMSVTGNHDVGVYVKDSISLPHEVCLSQVIARQRAMGWTVLQDTTVYLHRNADSITLSGLSFDSKLRHNRHDAILPPAELATVYRGIARDSLYNITAAHLPQLWSQIMAAGYGDLTLSGHVHSMQLKIKLFGRYLSPAQLLYSRWSGRYDENGHTLYINDGTGYVVYPMRLGAYPEITLITLKQCV
ncbi:MAG: metallophosphoesterase [Alistipes sp.]